jgi:K+-transporting ATPase c subunit
VAKARKLDEAVVQRLVALHTEGRLLSLFGEPRVNVLGLIAHGDEVGRH